MPTPRWPSSSTFQCVLRWNSSSSERGRVGGRERARLFRGGEVRGEGGARARAGGGGAQRRPRERGGACAREAREARPSWSCTQRVARRPDLARVGERAPGAGRELRAQVAPLSVSRSRGSSARARARIPARARARRAGAEERARRGGVSEARARARFRGRSGASLSLSLPQNRQILRSLAGCGLNDNMFGPPRRKEREPRARARAAAAGGGGPAGAAAGT